MADAAGSDEAVTWKGLTERERQVMVLVAAGWRHTLGDLFAVERLISVGLLVNSDFGVYHTDLGRSVWGQRHG